MPQSDLPGFDAATIKPVNPDAPHTTGVEIHGGGRLSIGTFSLKGMVAVAFNLSYWQVSAGPGWIEKDEYNLEAKPTDLSGITTLRYSLFAIEDRHLREMLQTLLTERFQLKIHRQTKSGRVYVLERTGKPLRLKANPAQDPTKDDDSRRFGNIGFVDGHWVITDTSMAQLVTYAADHVLRAPVSDRTGLTGSFHYSQPVHLPDSEANYSDPSDSFLRLIGELGLRLKRSRGPVETLVIDHAEKPAPN